MAQLNFDARQVAPATGFDPLPPGWYNVVVDESEMKPTKEGNGSYLKVRYSVIDGQYANRKIYGMINLQNANPQAVEIGLKQLSALAHAVGVLLVQDSQQLHNIPLKIKLKVRPAQGEYEAQNNVTQWENINAQVGDAAVAAVGQAPGFAPHAGAPGGFPSLPVGQPAQTAAPAGMPAWSAAPAAQAAPAAPAGQPWSQPTAQQPWAGQPQQPVQQPAQQQMPAANPAQPAPTGFNPGAAVPPWAQRS